MSLGRLVAALGAAGSLVTLYVGRGEVGDVWSNGYPAIQLAALSIAVLVLGGLLAWRSRKPTEGQIEIDRSLARGLLALLPSDGQTMRCLRDWDFGLQFRWEWFEPLHEFVDRWDDPERRFHLRRVEMARVDLHGKVAALTTRLAYVTGSDPGGWFSIVPAEYRDMFRLEPELRLWAERVDEIHDLAAAAVAAHQQFVTVARRYLEI